MGPPKSSARPGTQLGRIVADQMSGVVGIAESGPISCSIPPESRTDQRLSANWIGSPVARQVEPQLYGKRQLSVRAKRRQFFLLLSSTNLWFGRQRFPYSQTSREDSSQPALSLCQPDRCPNACITSRHRPLWEQSVQYAEEMLKSKGLSVLQREVLKDEIARQKRMLAPAEVD